jgi:hypothetical protein
VADMSSAVSGDIGLSVVDSAWQRGARVAPRMLGPCRHAEPPTTRLGTTAVLPRSCDGAATQERNRRPDCSFSIIAALCLWAP